jgi:hypothetical protein
LKTIGDTVQFLARDSQRKFVVKEEEEEEEEEEANL